MTYITIKTKKTNANVEIFPPTFTERQAIYIEPSKGYQTKMTVFPKGVYNVYKILYKINTSPLVEYIDLNIETINNNVYIKTNQI